MGCRSAAESTVEVGCDRGQPETSSTSSSARCTEVNDLFTEAKRLLLRQLGDKRAGEVEEAEEAREEEEKEVDFEIESEVEVVDDEEGPKERTRRRLVIEKEEGNGRWSEPAKRFDLLREDLKHEEASSAGR